MKTASLIHKVRSLDSTVIKSEEEGRESEGRVKRRIRREREEGKKQREEEGGEGRKGNLLGV